ncbi:hypothetical protein [Nocardia macrotermitis]|uniref:Uncharacterized protein n=1 Tax=Nocardia macrotermitis TaxID=2585198 RepID=A0A7K0CXK4_9NOCA|nr:hypothetical protein [Nocardia macrotermitis]MQY18227.1 hypothetical protein [Nocardia macrotermitis]
MSEDSTQLSVAELLARNGQGAPASGGGGRRRRSGRGIAVNEFTGDMPVVREGGSSHAAPEEPSGYDPAPDPALAYSPAPEPDNSPLSGPITFYNPLAPSSSPSESPGYASSGSGVDSFGPPSAPPTSGGRRARRELAESLAAQDDSAADPFGSAPVPEVPSPGGGGRRRRRDPDEQMTEVQPFRPQGLDSYAPGPDSRGANGFAPDSRGANGFAPDSRGANGFAPDSRGANGFAPDSRGANGFAPDSRGANGFAPDSRGANGFAPDSRGANGFEPGVDSRGANGYAPEPDSRGANGFGPGPDSRRPGANPFGSGTRAPGADSFGADSRGAGATAFMPAPNPLAPGGNSFSPGPDPAGPSGWGSPRGPEPMAQPGPQNPDRGDGPPSRMGRRNGADGPPPPGGLPAWSARRRGPGAPDRNAAEPPRNGAEPPRNGMEPPTAMWSPGNQGKPGPAPGGDPRDDLDPRGGRPLPSDPMLSRDARPVTDLLAVDVNGRTEIYPAVGPDFDPDQDDLDLDYDEDDDDLLDFDEDEDEDDDDFDEPPARRNRRAPKRSGRDTSISARSKALLQSDRPSWLSFGGGQETGRRQWLVLAGQVVGAAVAGMLLFKGFEKMWDLLPFVALALAVVVILGLVALVRVLRRTDDMYSTVIAVVVGIFVTLGPLAFLLSTN